MKQPSSLFVRTSLTIFISLFIFLAFAALVVFQNLISPIARQSAGDMAALMLLSAQTWVELPVEARPRFEIELKQYHRLYIAEQPQPLDKIDIHHLFYNYLLEAFEKRLNQPVIIPGQSTRNETRFIWVDIPIAEHTIQIGFPYSHIEPNPPRVLFLLLSGAAVLIFLTSTLLVRHLIRPLENLSQATLQMGRGNVVAPLQETGARELKQLARSFNQMNARVQQLLDNRTTLFAGISHDLRTPISRLHLALELMEDKPDRELIQAARSDLEEMNHLIQQTLELAVGKEQARIKCQIINLNRLITDEVKKFRLEYPAIIWSELPACRISVSPTAVQRILQNLLHNAVCYGQSKDISIGLEQQDDQVVLCVTDQGKGIPQEKTKQIFEPFFRLEQSRNAQSGGSGLGLAIVRQLCDLYGWEITVQSELNEGSVFCLHIYQGTEETIP